MHRYTSNGAYFFFGVRTLPDTLSLSLAQVQQYPFSSSLSLLYPDDTPLSMRCSKPASTKPATERANAQIVLLEIFSFMVLFEYECTHAFIDMKSIGFTLVPRERERVRCVTLLSISCDWHLVCRQRWSQGNEWQMQRYSMSSFVFIGRSDWWVLCWMSTDSHHRYCFRSNLDDAERRRIDWIIVSKSEYENTRGITVFKWKSVSRASLQFRLFLEESGELLSQHDVALHFEFALGEKLRIEEKFVIDWEEKQRVSTTYSRCTRFAGR